jgi:threonine dehydratase
MHPRSAGRTTRGGRWYGILLDAEPRATSPFSHRVAMPISPLPSPDDIRAAAARIGGLVHRTALTRSPGLSALAGGDVYLKREDTQVTGSFKARGAFNAVAQLSPDDRARGVVASSAGNHGLGVARAARHFGVPATIYVPADAPQVKKRGIAELGARVDDGQADYDLAMTAAKAHAAAHGLLFINPCLGDALLAGQGTVALEILDDLPDVRTVVVCVGGGGLLGGVGGYLRGAAPDVRVVGAQSERTAAMSRSVAAGRVVEIESQPTLADGLAGQIDDAALAIGQAALDEIVTLTEDEIARAIAWLARHEGVTAEGAGAVAVGAVLHGRTRPFPTPAVVIVSGGNIDADRLARIMESCPADARSTDA